MEQLEEVEHEMKISQLLHHSNIVCYLTSFVVGTHLCAIQPLMHYGVCVCVHVCAYVKFVWLCMHAPCSDVPRPCCTVFLNLLYMYVVIRN